MARLNLLFRVLLERRQPKTIIMYLGYIHEQHYHHSSRTASKYHITAHKEKFIKPGMFSEKLPCKTNITASRRLRSPRRRWTSDVASRFFRSSKFVLFVRIVPLLTPLQGSRNLVPGGPPQQGSSCRYCPFFRLTCSKHGARTWASARAAAGEYGSCLTVRDRRLAMLLVSSSCRVGGLSVVVVLDYRLHLSICGVCPVIELECGESVKHSGLPVDDEHIVHC